MILLSRKTGHITFISSWLGSLHAKWHNLGFRRHKIKKQTCSVKNNILPISARIMLISHEDGASQSHLSPLTFIGHGSYELPWRKAASWQQIAVKISLGINSTI
jgi:hypothetical protein